MKYKILFLIILLFLLSGCQNQTAQTQELENVNSRGNHNAALNDGEDFVLDNNREISIEESNIEDDSIKIKQYELKKQTVKKIVEGDTIPSDITNAVLLKNGKLIETFEGVEYPLGNEINFGLFSFSSDGNKQVIISDISNRYERNWILDLSKDFKILLDTADYGVYRSGLSRIDFDNDGIFEITMARSDDIFGFASALVPDNSIIFKLDKEKQKFLPASHILQDYTMKNLSESLEGFNAGNEKSFSKVLQITLNYIYAGKESEAWEFFDKNFVTDEMTFTIKVENKEQAKAEIIKYLSKNPIYNFIKNDSKNK